MSTTTTHTTASKAGPCSSWPATLHSILLPASFSPFEQNGGANINYNPKHHRHPSGMIWKQILGQCVYNDLFQEENYGSLMFRQRRRFARLQCLGLSGIVFYEIPMHHAGFTLKTVFGDRTDKSAPGMTVDGLLDGVGARVVYFPSYSCTSFVCGQAISAFFQQQPRLRPVPASYGFSVDARAFINASFTVQQSFALDLLDTFCSPSPFMSLGSYGLIQEPVDSGRKMTNTSFRSTLSVDYGASSLERLIEKELLSHSLRGTKTKREQAIVSQLDKFLTSQSSSLSFVAKDNELGNDTCTSTLGSTATPRKKVDTEDSLFGKMMITKDNPAAVRRRRRNMVALSLSSLPDSGLASRSLDRRIYSTSLVELEPDTSLLQEPALLNSQSALRPTRTQAAVPTRKSVLAPPKTRALIRTPKGKENIAPMPMRSQRR